VLPRTALSGSERADSVRPGKADQPGRTQLREGRRHEDKPCRAGGGKGRPGTAGYGLAWQRAARFERDVLSQPGRMYRAARCLAADRAAAEDLAEETVARACAALGQVELGATVTADG